MLRCEGLCKSFGGLKALAGVTLEFPLGITAIIGPNGAGKTTLVNVLTGFDRPDLGRCLLGSEDITGLAPAKIVRRGVCRTFQELRLLPGIPALQHLLLARPGSKGEGFLDALLGLGVSKREASGLTAGQKLLEFVGLEQSAQVPAGQLSYGQQKLLTLACALANEPQVLILDEPMSGVHPDAIEFIIERLRTIREQERTVVFIEHDLQAVRRLADRVIVMDNGSVIGHGDPKEVLQRPEIMEAYVG